jgi:hypothetical protein
LPSNKSHFLFGFSFFGGPSPSVDLIGDIGFCGCKIKPWQT